MTSFAYQGFGFGEFFKAQQKLQEILDCCFYGVFDAPSGFLSLARTLETLACNIERLFDENANPNSAILRAENKPHAQQMLRIASHGLIDSLVALEKAIPIREAAGDPLEMRGFNIVMHLQLSGQEGLLRELEARFAFMSWKLELLFRVLRKSRVKQTLTVYDGVQKRIGSFFEELAARKSTASNETMSSTGAYSESSGIQDIDVIQRFQDACEFGGGGHNFVWKLKPESTLLITLHWVFYLSINNDPKNYPVEAYVNLMKCSWLLRVTTPDAGVEGFSDEMRTMIGLLGCDVVYRLQEYFEKDAEPPLPSELLDRGDFSIFVDGINRKDLCVGLVRTAVPSAFPGQSVQIPVNYDIPQSIDHRMQNSPFEHVPPAIDGYHQPDSARSSLEYDPRHAHPRITPISPADIRPRPQGGRLSTDTDMTMVSVHSASSSVSSLIGPNRTQMTGSDLYRTGSRGSHPGLVGSSIPAAMPSPAKRVKPSYSWNEIVDRENLGVRPGEVEILPKDFEIMQMYASYTGDKHGRWDICRVRIFKLMEDKTLRILTMMEGLEESIDQRVAYVKEAELVPDYGYHQNHPIIYIRKTHRQDPFLHGNANKVTGKPMDPSSLYYKFRNAHDMFNFQFALLGEAVETDFQAVRTVRFKKSNRDGEHSHYKARIQLWREQDEEEPVLSSTPTVAPPVTRAAWQPPSLKVHTTRVVMYWDETITTFFITDSIDLDHRSRRFTLRIRPSSHRAMAFSNPTSVKARTFGSRDMPGGFRLDKKGLFPDDEENFDDFKWFEIEFNNQDEVDNFTTEFKRALNIRRRERLRAEELMRAAARGVPAGQEVNVVTRSSGRR